jgi:hypothetical protein
LVAHSDATLSGLLTGPRVMNAATTLRSSGPSRVSEASSTSENLVLGPSYFISGTMTTESTSTFTGFGSGPLTWRSRTTFDGPIATMVREIGGTTWTCIYDQSNRSALPVCS